MDSCRRVRKKSVLEIIGHSSEYPARIPFQCKWKKFNRNTLTQRVAFVAYLTRLQELPNSSYFQKWLRTGMQKTAGVAHSLHLHLGVFSPFLLTVILMALAALRLVCSQFCYARDIVQISVLRFKML